ncbi:F-box protein At4g00893 [Linum perenne]
MIDIVERPWSDLPWEILSSITERLFGKDITSLRRVCTHWRSAPAPRAKHINNVPVSEIVKHPFSLRIRCNNHSSPLLQLYSPAYNKTYFLDAPLLHDAQILGSNHGWLLLSRNKGTGASSSIFFLQPSTGDVIKLPRNERLDRFNVMSFSAPPTSPNCVVFGLSDMFPRPDEDGRHVYITFIRRGDSAWRNYNDGGYPNKMRKRYFSHRRLVPRYRGIVYSKKKRLPPKITNKFRPITCRGSFAWYNYCSAPVFHNGAFYCVGKLGQLGVFDLSKKNMWSVIDTLCVAFFRASSCEEVYLTESSRGELMAVLVGHMGQHIRVYRFNHGVQQWQTMCSLEDQVVFLSHTSSIVLSCKELHVKGFENTIHFAGRFRGVDDNDNNNNVFYSMSTRNFYTFKDGYTSENLRDTKLQLNSTWIVPRFRCYSDEQLDWTTGGTQVLVQHHHHDNDNVHPSFLIRDLSLSQVLVPKMAPEEHKPAGFGGGRRPWIILSHTKKKKKRKEAYCFMDLVDNTMYSRDNMEPALGGKQVYGCGNGRILLVDPKSGECFLLNTSSSSMAMDPLPPCKIPSNLTVQCLLHQDSSSGQLLVIAFGFIKSNDNDDDGKVVIASCGVGDKEWTIRMGGPRVFAVVSYQGKIYAIGLVPGKMIRFFEMELQRSEEDGGYCVKVVKTVLLPLYKPMGHAYTNYYLVESYGHLFVFEKFVSNELHEVIMEVRAHKIDVKTMTWEVVEDFGDTTFFFGYMIQGFECSGFPRNCLYFLHQYLDQDNVVRYDYDDHSVTTVLSCQDEIKDYEILEIVMC